MRLFLAVDVPGAVKRKIVALQEGLSAYKRFIRFSPPENLHITVKFLGEQNEFALNKIVEISQDVASSVNPFEINLENSGMFGGLTNPRILWLGDNSSMYVEVAKRFNEALEIFRASDHEPVCHLTIGRIKGMGRDEALNVLRSCREFVRNNRLSFRVNEICLYKSTLFRSGPVYEVIKRFKVKEMENG